MSGCVPVAVATLTDTLIGYVKDADNVGTWFPEREVDVKRIQIAKPPHRPQLPVEIDTRTPSGRVLPF